jgi:ubiquinone/menaquinone biosynthesis C-methylase UbiE
MYDESIATHYEAYRPPLHEVILERVIGSSGKKQTGLDIGCGTGRSSCALKKYCDLVIGLDPGVAMLGKAETTDGIVYASAAGERFPLAAQSVDIVTLAGSLNYIDPAMLVCEIKRVCGRDAVIIVYDFEIDLSSVENQLGLERLYGLSDYNHAANLSGYSELRETSVGDDVLTIDLSPPEIAHLLLSERKRAEAFYDKYQVPDLFNPLVREIEDSGSMRPFNAAIFYSVYSLH